MELTTIYTAAIVSVPLFGLILLPMLVARMTEFELATNKLEVNARRPVRRHRL